MKNKKWSLINVIVLFAVYFKMTLKICLQYKLDRGLITIAVLIREAANVIITILLLNTFGSIKGWSMNEILFLYSFLFLSYSIFVFFFTGIRDFEDIVYTGELDRFLLRPVGILFQVIASKVDYTAAIGHGVLGIYLFFKTQSLVEIEWNFTSILYLIGAILGGAIIQASIFMISSCFSFWTIKTTNIRNLLFFNCRKFSAYPITFFPIFIQKLLIFVIPFSFVNYFPALYFLRKEEINNFPICFLYLTPIIAITVFMVVTAIWKKGLQHYSSTGNSIY